MDHVRELILRLAEERDTDLKALSLGIGRNHAYLQQFVKRGTPKELPENTRYALAELLQVDQRQLIVHKPAQDRRNEQGGSANARVGSVTPLDYWLPAYGQAVGGKDGQFVLNGNRVADVLAPPSLRGVPDAYAVYVVGDSMEPRYQAGEVVFVNPRLPVRSGNYVVAQIAAAEGEPPLAYVKRFISLDAKVLRLEQFAPKRKLEFPATQVVSIHKIIMGGDG